MTIDELKTKAAAFAQEREWEQFHTPKNLAMALAGEAGELLEIFQWLDPDASFLTGDQKAKSRAKEEIADILIYLVRLSDRLDIDPLAAAEEKLKANAEKYPVALSKGNARKYTDLNE